MAVTATLTAAIKLTQTAGDDFGGGTFDKVIQRVQALTNGTAANQADIAFVDLRTVSSASNDDIDLSGSVTDVFGNTVTMAEMVALLVINAPLTGSANTTDLTIGAAASNPFEGFLGGTSPVIGPLKPGAALLIFAGDAAGLGTVSGGSADVLRVANSSGADATYQIAVLGRSA